MLTIRTSKFNTTIKKPSSALFLWFHNSKGWFVGYTEVTERAGHSFRLARRSGTV